jgi:Protein of unknown function (DUF3181)
MTSAGSSEEIEKLAVAIAEDLYLDVAKWHLYIDDVKDEKLHIVLAEQLFPLVAEAKVTKDAVDRILAGIKITIGGGKQEIPMSQFIPGNVESMLMDVLTAYKI